MPPKTRPTLTSLADRMARKDHPTPVAAAAAPEAVEARAIEPEAKGDGRVQVLVRMTPAERKALRQIALDQDTTVQALVEESLRDLIRRHGVSPS